MIKTKIPWCDYTINPVKGLCPMACSHCYARRMYKRFKWNPEIRYDGLAFDSMPSPYSRIFVGSTMELFGDWVNPGWLRHIFLGVKSYPQHTFIFLTKQPQNLIRWSPFPNNCHVGISATNTKTLMQGCSELEEVRSKVKFISIEPLLEWSYSWTESYLENSLKRANINWLIIGSQTQPTRHPPREWVDEIINAADKSSIPVFIKEPMASHYDIQRQEYPV